MFSDGTVYNEDYFEHGEEKGISGYTNYRWISTRTLTTATSLIRRANINITDTILDYGAAKGFLVKAFTWLGYDAYGVDISEYALSHVDEEVKHRLFRPQELPKKSYDVIICKDILEHIPYDDINEFLRNIFQLSNRMVIAIVPLGDGQGKYVIPKFENDITHIIREPKEWWLEQIINAGGVPTNYSDDVTDIKPNWNVPNGNLYVEIHRGN
jgi:cyclopropane fatty-acyl-phospholipid synthase-like methyltransferase